GKTLAQAEQEISAQGLTIGNPVGTAFVGVNGCNQPKGLVCDQNPVAGIQLNHGEAVHLTVSLGAQQVQVPDVRTLSRTDAANTLKNAKLVVGTVTSQNANTPAGTVLDQ